MSFVKFALLTELRKVLQGKKTKPSKDTLLFLAAAKLLANITI
jgi:hypothetical protein